jgi:hypothetical protein
MDTRGSGRAPAACAEFPNDNPALHMGAIWRCTAWLGTLSCERPTRRPAWAAGAESDREPLEAVELEAVNPEIPGTVQLEALNRETPRTVQLEGVDEMETDDGEPIEIVDDLAFDDAFDEEPGTAQDPFRQLVDILGDSARALGGDDESLRCLHALFGLIRTDTMAPAGHVTLALVAGQVLVEGARGLTRTREFTGQVLAWQGILRGESEDFGALGPLDEWAADVVARAIGNPSRADAIRRELRRRGVAAFGVVAQAA